MKIKNIFISCFLSLIMSLSFILPTIISSKESLKIREINVNELGTLSYEEKVKKILEPFNSYNGTINDNELEFEATIETENLENNTLNLKNVNSNEKITKKFKTRLDIENERFFIITQYIQDKKIVYKEEFETIPQYDVDSDDYIIEMPDGELISMRSQLEKDSFNECLATEMAVGAVSKAAADAVIGAAAANPVGAVVVLLAATIIVCSPTIRTTISTIVTQVVSWVRSFFRWFKSLFKKVTTYVTSQVITQTLSPAISIDNVKYETKELTKDIVLTLSLVSYYLCFADPTNGKMYISILPIDYNIALTIMSCPILVPCIGNSNKEMVASIFSVNQIFAYEVTVNAGIYNIVPENHGVSKGYYWHYHSIYEVPTKQGTMARPHAFFQNFSLA